MKKGGVKVRSAGIRWREKRTEGERALLKILTRECQGVQKRGRGKKRAACEE